MKLYYFLKILIGAFVIGIGVTMIVTLIGFISGAEMLLEPSASRVVMIITTIIAVPICLKYMKNSEQS